MESTELADPLKPAMEEAAIAGASSLSMMETMHHDNSPLVITGDTDEGTTDGASSIIQALNLLQVIYLAFTGIIALLFAIFNIVAFAVLVVASIGYFGFFWYSAASSVKTRENVIALAIRSFSVAAVLAAFSLPADSEFKILQFLPNILLLLVVSVFDWRWNGLFS